MASWMASPTWWTWVSVNSGSWWWTGRPGMLQFMGLPRVGHDWGLNWTELKHLKEQMLERVWRERNPPARLFAMYLGEMLAFSVHWSWIKKDGDRTWRKQKGGFNPQPVERETQGARAPRTVPPSSMRSLGAYIRQGLAVMRNKCVRIFSKTVIGWRQ